jgi:hypothetical protein
VSANISEKYTATIVTADYPIYLHGMFLRNCDSYPPTRLHVGITQKTTVRIFIVMESFRLHKWEGLKSNCDNLEGHLIHLISHYFVSTADDFFSSVFEEFQLRIRTFSLVRAEGIVIFPCHHTPNYAG